MKDLRRALYGEGNFSVHGPFTRHHLTYHAWQNLTTEQRTDKFSRFLADSGKRQSAPTVTASDGGLTVVCPAVSCGVFCGVLWCPAVSCGVSCGVLWCPAVSCGFQTYPLEWIFTGSLVFTLLEIDALEVVQDTNNNNRQMKSK